MRFIDTKLFTEWFEARCWPFGFIFEWPSSAVLCKRPY